jgi:hypothetical protein
MSDPASAEDVRLFRRALILGVTGALLLRLIPWGAGAFLWSILFLAAAVGVLAGTGRAVLPALVLPVTICLVAAAGIVWRDSPVLLALDVVALFGGFILFSLGPRGIRAGATGVSLVVLSLVLTLGQSVAGLFRLLFRRPVWRGLGGQSESAPANSTASGRWTVIRGVIIAFPALLVFGGLLVAADAGFATLLNRLIRFDVADVLATVVVGLFITAVCAGFFHSLATGDNVTPLGRPAFFSLGASEVTIALALIDALFGLFVAVQFRYLFGGSAAIGTASSLTHSEYARRGFFELVTVVALVVPMLLAAEWIIDKRDARTVARFRIAAVVQVLLVLMIAGSAWHRMALYRDAFGLTELRLYTTAFMLWLAFILLYLAATVLTGQRQRFFVGATASAVAALLAVHAVNPDALIVRTNAGRAVTGERALDTTYATTLGADATPALLANLERLGPDRACAAKTLLHRDAKRPRSWRTWNWSRWRAHLEIEERRPELQRYAASCVPLHRS